MKRLLLSGVLISTILFSFFDFFIIHSYGFEGSTLVAIHYDREKQIPIKQLCKQAAGRKKRIASVAYPEYRCVECWITSVGKSVSDYGISINVDGEQEQDIICAPQQEFYLLNKGWVPAYELQVGDVVWSKFAHYKTITKLELIGKAIKVYALKVDPIHAFFVGRHELLAHNMLLPMVSLGLGTSFGTGAKAGGFLGGCFGPVGITVGVAVGGLLGMGVHYCVGKRSVPHYDIEYYPAPDAHPHIVFTAQQEHGKPQKLYTPPTQKPEEKP